MSDTSNHKTQEQLIKQICQNAIKRSSQYTQANSPTSSVIEHLTEGTVTAC